MPPAQTSGHHSPAALAARRANLAKAHAAPKSRVYRPTEKRQAASRRNLLKAQAALRGRRTAARLNALQHGLFAREFDAETFRRLREDPQEYREILRLLRRAFRPQEVPERELVTRLAQTCWRRLRLCRAFAAREQLELRQALESIPALPQPLSEEETAARANLLLSTIAMFVWDPEEEPKLLSEMESLLRALLRKRSSGRLEYHRNLRRRDSRLVEVDSLGLHGRALEELSEEELTERLRYLHPSRLLAMQRRAPQNAPGEQEIPPAGPQAAQEDPASEQA